MREERWDDIAAKDYDHWQRTDKDKANKIDELLADIQRDPFNGIGKPEPLKHNWAGCWSREISPEHRLVYEVTDDAILIYQCRWHYSKK
jgi:toxin YoeB